MKLELHCGVAPPHPASSAGSQARQTLPTHCPPPQSPSDSHATHVKVVEWQTGVVPPHPESSAGSHARHVVPTHCGVAPPQSESTSQPTQVNVTEWQSGVDPLHPASSAGSQRRHWFETHCRFGSTVQCPSMRHATQLLGPQCGVEPRHTRPLPLVPRLLPQVQIPVAQSSPVPHATPHAPQCALSSSRLRQLAAPQHVSVEPVHASPPPGVPETLPHVQRIDVHVSLVPQMDPQPPQC